MEKKYDIRELINPSVLKTIKTNLEKSYKFARDTCQENKS